MESSHETRFKEKLYEMYNDKRNNSVYFSQDRLDSIVNSINNFDTLPAKTKQDYNWKHLYEVYNCDGINFLRKRGTSKQIVSMENMFNILQSAHTITIHGGRDAMYRHLHQTFWNVTKEIIGIFNSLCEPCQLKKLRKKKGLVTNPILSSDLNSRCQVDLIDYQSQPDGPFKFVLNYQDHLTKFVQLRPLKTKTAQEVAEVLLEIFCDKGAPLILQSDNGREFANKVIIEILKMWPSCKMVHGKPRHSQSQGSVERANLDVQNKIACWLKDNNTTTWTVGLKFVQLAKNSCYHSGIKRTPYEALYGTPPKIGLSSTMIPPSIYNNFSTAEDLENMLEKPHQSNHDLASSSDNNNNIVSPNNVMTSSYESLSNSNSSDVFQTDAGNSGTHSINLSNDDNEQSEFTCVICELSCHVDCICSECFLNVHFDTACSVVVTPESDSQPKHVCLLCNKKSRIASNREDAYSGLVSQAEKMKQNSVRSFLPAKVGDNVIVPIPEVDRAKTDFRNLTAVVLSVENNFYQLGTKEGILKSLYARNQFDVCSENFLSEEEVPKREIALRTAAISASVGSGQGFLKCTCTTNCTSKRCKCKKGNVLCNSKCHSSRPCNNK